MKNTSVPAKFANAEVVVVGSGNSNRRYRAMGTVAGCFLALGTALALNITMAGHPVDAELSQRLFMANQTGTSSLTEGLQMHKDGSDACFSSIPVMEDPGPPVYFEVEVVPCSEVEKQSGEGILTPNTEKMINTVLGRPYFKGGDMSDASIRSFATAAAQAEWMNRTNFHHR